MVAEWEGDALLEEMNASSYEATFVPINCIESSETKQTQSLCEPAAASDATYVQEDRVDGGTLSVSGETFEYLLAEFGRPFIGKERRVVDVGDGCLPTKEDLTGAIAIARRGGGCQFLEKAWRAQEAGAAEVLISNRDATDALVRAGCHPRWAARNVTVPVGLVSLAAGSALRSAKTASVTPSHGGHGAAWASLEKYASGDAKPRSKKAQLKKVDALSAERHGAAYPERRAFLASGKDEL